MPNRTSPTGVELFIVDNSDTDWKVLRYLHYWCRISKAIDIATGYFEIGSLLVPDTIRVGISANGKNMLNEGRRHDKKA